MDGGVFDPSDSDDLQLKYGFRRPEMYKTSLAGTVDPYDRHIFLCYNNPENWPASVEDADFDPLQRLLAAALKSRKNDFHTKIRLTICEGRDGTEPSNGDVLIFPEMIRYRGLTHLGVDSFVEDVLLRGSRWALGVPERLMGSHIFVCCHRNRDRRCGLCGPLLVERFREEIELRAIKHQVFVSPCSHLGGHQYAGNLIIFSADPEGKCKGHWYGYVTPNDVPVLLDEHIRKGKIIEQLWRGQMGSLNSEEKNVYELKLQKNGVVPYLNKNNLEKGEKNSLGSSNKGNKEDGTSCCCGADRVSCPGNKNVEENTGIGEKYIKEGIRVCSRKGLGRL